MSPLGICAKCNAVIFKSIGKQLNINLIRANGQCAAVFPLCRYRYIRCRCDFDLERFGLNTIPGCNDIGCTRTDAGNNSLIINCCDRRIRTGPCN